ncbi:HAMP domain-containing histidine kinase [candidate division KSB1 bacterium]|nr:HAMP domain-containing histidine kinase [candidate division KSB1 bacterium]
MFSIKTKIIAAYTFFFGALLIVLLAVIYATTRINNYQKFDTRLRNFAKMIKVEIEEQVIDEEELDIAEIRAMPREGLLDVNIRLVQSDGQEFYADRPFDHWPSIRKNADASKQQHFYDVHIGREHFRCVAGPVEAKKDTFYTLQVLASLRDVNADLNRLFTLFIVIVPLAFVVTGFSAYVISGAAFRPIAKMTVGANAISLQNLETRLDLPKVKDEVYELGQTLNNMIARIESAYKSQKQFVASASHELRTPLTIIQTELELALKKLNDPTANDNIKTALAEIEGLTQLTTSLLLLSKVDAVQLSLQKELLRLDELLIDCVHAMQPSAAKKGIRLDLQIEEAVEMMADKEKLKRVCLNLLDNAVKYTPLSGTVSVILEAGNNSRVGFHIKDSGVGIAVKDLPHIFKRFYRSDETRAKAPGSGLGLAIVQELVALHKGSVIVDSASGRGSTFSVELPLR